MAFSFGNPGGGNLGGSTGGAAGGSAQLGPDLEDIQTSVCTLFQHMDMIIAVANKNIGDTL